MKVSGVQADTRGRATRLTLESHSAADELLLTRIVEIMFDPRVRAQILAADLDGERVVRWTEEQPAEPEPG